MAHRFSMMNSQLRGWSRWNALPTVYTGSPAIPL